jgi:hypothetical protein
MMTLRYLIRLGRIFLHIAGYLKRTQEVIKLATPHRLRELEQEHNATLDDLIPSTVNKLGSQKSAADALGVSQATISTWLRDNGYTPKTVYIKETKGEQIA